MSTAKLLSAAVLIAGLGTACGGADREASSNAAGGDTTTTAREERQATQRPAAITVTGCLTSANGQFVLTELERGGTAAAPGQTATETYQLTNADDQLRSYVGREVRVNGEAEAPRIAEVRETTPGSGAAAGTSGADTGSTVSTESRTRLEVRKLSVSSVTPTGDECPAR
jgi:hypothetical protein